VTKIRLEASSDGMLAIAITLLVTQLPPRSTPASRPRPMAAVVQLRRLPGELPDQRGDLLPFPAAVVAEHLEGRGEAAPTASTLDSGVLVLLALAVWPCSPG